MSEWFPLNGVGTSPSARSSHSLAVVGDQAFVFGGESQPRVPIGDQLYAWDMKILSWTEVQTNGPSPGPRVGHTAAAIGDRMYVFGGRTGVQEGEGTINDLYAFDATNARWSEVITKGEPPAPRSFHAMAACGSALYIFGGVGTKGRLNDLHQFNIEKGSWQQMPSDPAVKGRGGAGLVASSKQDSLYVIGGFCGHELGDVHRFNTADGTWSHLSAASIPPRSVFGAASLADGRIVVFGGEIDPSDQGHAGAGDFSDATLVFDTKDESKGWREVELRGTRPAARGWYAASGLPDGIIIHGGNALDNSRLADLQILRLKSITSTHLNDSASSASLAHTNGHHEPQDDRPTPARSTTSIRSCR